MANNINQYSSVSGCSISNGSEHEVSDFRGPNDPGQVHYTYINDEHLKMVSDGPNTYNLSYDALGRCVKRTLNGTITYYIYDGEKPIVEYNSSGTIVARNVYGKGMDEILMRKETGINDGNWVYYAHDHEGSVTHLLDGRSTPSSQTGNVIERYKYDAFGTPTFYDGGWTQLNSTAYNNRFLFTGREYAATYRQIYTQSFTFYEYRARAYNPTLGRFMSEDPKLFDAGDYNLFRYCHNDPIDFTDPMGLDHAGPAPTSSVEHLWEMTKWFDRSNILQGNFAGFGTLSGQSDRAANGGLTMGQMMKGHTTGHRNFFSRLFHPRARVTGGTYEQRKLYREAIKKVFGSEHGGDYVREIDVRGYGVTVHLTHEDDAYSMGAPSSRVNIDPNYSGEVKTMAGCIPPTPTRLISHEFGHAVMGTLDDGPNRMNNVLRNENPIMRELGEPERLQYALCP